jgi:nucleotide-binding universal stress UspA family protein
MESSKVVKQKKNFILWAVDPTQKPAQVENLIKELNLWAKSLGCDIQPVTVFSKSIFTFPAEVELPWKEGIEDVVTNSIKNYIKKTSAKNFLPPQAVFVPDISNRSMAYELARYAEAQGAMLIFANTLAKKSWNPFRLGGFAETLVTVSNVPVLLMNPTAKSSGATKNILFATDFGRESKNALSRLLPWAQSLKAKVSIYNQVETPQTYMTEFAGIAQFPVLNSEPVMKDIMKMRIKKGQSLVSELEKENLTASVVIQRQSKLLSTQIVEAAKKNKANLIALASHRGSFAQAVLGGTSRDILLQAACPVLIFHRPKAVRTTTSKEVVGAAKSRPVLESGDRVR